MLTATGFVWYRGARFSVSLMRLTIEEFRERYLS